MKNEQQNIGVEKAVAAAAAVGGKLVVPPDPGDINDYWMEHDDDEVVELLESGKVVAAINTRSTDDSEASLTEFGFADRFAQKFNGQVHYLEDVSQWIKRGENGHWKYADGEITELVKSSAADLLDEAKIVESDRQRNDIVKFALR